MRMELREKDNIIEEMNEQIKKLQDRRYMLFVVFIDQTVIF